MFPRSKGEDARGHGMKRSKNVGNRKKNGKRKKKGEMGDEVTGRINGQRGEISKFKPFIQNRFISN